MRYHQSMVNKILLMIIITGFFLDAVVITAGATMIYSAEAVINARTSCGIRARPRAVTG